MRTCRIRQCNAWWASCLGTHVVNTSVRVVSRRVADCCFAVVLDVVCISVDRETNIELECLGIDAATPVLPSCSEPVGAVLLASTWKPGQIHRSPQNQTDQPRRWPTPCPAPQLRLQVPEESIVDATAELLDHTTQLRAELHPSERKRSHCSDEQRIGRQRRKTCAQGLRHVTVSENDHRKDLPTNGRRPQEGEAEHLAWPGSRESHICLRNARTNQCGLLWVTLVCTVHCACVNGHHWPHLRHQVWLRKSYNFRTFVEGQGRPGYLHSRSVFSLVLQAMMR